jgi:sugar/nucleoside kinase (ribokinase family)
MAIDLIGIGSPLVDTVVEVDDSFLSEHVSGAKGGMEMVSLEDIEALIHRAESDPVHAPGGAASNTTIGCAGMGLNAAFIGCCGDDEIGNYYREALQRFGCEDRLLIHEHEPTGRVLSLVTPDAERTMRTTLGAAAHLRVDTFEAEVFQDVRMVMLEGYALFDHALTRHVASLAAAAGAGLALDLASFEVVEANREVIQELLDGPVSVVFANEDEAKAWAGSIEAAIEDLSQRCEVAVIKLGAEGAWIVSGDERIHIPAAEVEQVVDTTGAGDTWAAGFLVAHLRGLPLHYCGKLGAEAAAIVVGQTGAHLSVEQWLSLRGYMDGWAN